MDWYYTKEFKTGTIDILFEHANPIRKASFLRWNGNDLIIGEELQNKISKTISILVNQDNTLVDIYKLPTAEKDSIFQLLIEIYENHLNRNVTEAENVILLHALHIWPDVESYYFVKNVPLYLFL